MAAPSFRSRSAVSYAAGTTLPTSWPAGLVRGDLVLALSGFTGDVSSRLSTPSGWTRLDIDFESTPGQHDLLARLHLLERQRRGPDLHLRRHEPQPGQPDGRLPGRRVDTTDMTRRPRPAPPRRSPDRPPTPPTSSCSSSRGSSRRRSRRRQVSRPAWTTSPASAPRSQIALTRRSARPAR